MSLPGGFLLLVAFVALVLLALVAAKAARAGPEPGAGPAVGAGPVFGGGFVTFTATALDRQSVVSGDTVALPGESPAALASAFAATGWSAMARCHFACGLQDAWRSAKAGFGPAPSGARLTPAPLVALARAVWASRPASESAAAYLDVVRENLAALIAALRVCRHEDAAVAVKILPAFLEPSLWNELYLRSARGEPDHEAGAAAAERFRALAPALAAAAEWLASGRQAAVDSAVGRFRAAATRVLAELAHAAADAALPPLFRSHGFAFADWYPQIYYALNKRTAAELQDAPAPDTPARLFAGVEALGALLARIPAEARPAFAPELLLAAREVRDALAENPDYWRLLNAGANCLFLATGTGASLDTTSEFSAIHAALAAGAAERFGDGEARAEAALSAPPPAPAARTACCVLLEAFDAFGAACGPVVPGAAGPLGTLRPVVEFLGDPANLAGYVAPQLEAVLGPLAGAGLAVFGLEPPARADTANAHNVAFRRLAAAARRLLIAVEAVVAPDGYHVSSAGLRGLLEYLKVDAAGAVEAGDEDAVAAAARVALEKANSRVVLVFAAVASAAGEFFSNVAALKACPEFVNIMNRVNSAWAAQLDTHLRDADYQAASRVEFAETPVGAAISLPEGFGAQMARMGAYLTTTAAIFDYFAQHTELVPAAKMQVSYARGAFDRFRKKLATLPGWGAQN